MSIGRPERSTSTPISLAATELSGAGTLTNLLQPPATVNVLGGTFCPAVGEWGDLDHDRLANSRDALAIVTHVVGLPLDTTVFHTSLGDADGDGLVNTRDALIVLLKMGAPVLLVALVVGLAISLVQALTQIQEMTLTFVPKILAMFLAMLVALPFMGDQLQGHMARLAARIAGG